MFGIFDLVRCGHCLPWADASCWQAQRLPSIRFFFWFITLQILDIELIHTKTLFKAEFIHALF